MFLFFASLSTKLCRRLVGKVSRPSPRVSPRATSTRHSAGSIFPTLLWLNAATPCCEDSASQGWPPRSPSSTAGPSFVALLFCYLAYLSLDLPMGLIFPLGLRALRSQPISRADAASPSLEAVHPPEPAIAWMYRLLLFRVMFGFGKFKFLGADKHDRGYLKGFLINQPLPSYIGWYMQKLPMWMLKGALLLMFIAEIPVPFLLFFPGEPASSEASPSSS